MAIQSRPSTTLQSYTMLVYRKALHPEFFGLEGRNRIDHEGYDFEGWIYKGGHVVRFQLDGQCVSEVVLDNAEHLPERGLVASLPCAGEKDFEERFSDSLQYMTTMQTETLSDHLYMGTYKEMLDHARENNSIFSAWTDDDGRPNLSLLDIQRHRDEVHTQGYHLRSDCGLVLRTQSLFQLGAAERVETD